MRETEAPPAGRAFHQVQMFRGRGGTAPNCQAASWRRRSHTLLHHQSPLTSSSFEQLSESKVPQCFRKCQVLRPTQGCPPHVLSPWAPGQSAQPAPVDAQPRQRPLPPQVTAPVHAEPSVSHVPSVLSPLGLPDVPRPALLCRPRLGSSSEPTEPEEERPP